VDGGTQLGLDALDPAFAPRPLLRVTPARLASWADCPRRYRLTYVDRPAPPRSGARAASTLGAVVHLALRSYFDLPVGRRSPDAAAALVDRHWSGEGFRDAEQAARYRLRAREWVAVHDETSLQEHLSRAEDAAQDAADAVDALATGGAADVLFPPRPAPRCGSCDVRRHCREGRAAAPEREPWASLEP
jgi:hypothetical protein